MGQIRLPALMLLVVAPLTASTLVVTRQAQSQQTPPAETSKDDSNRWMQAKLHASQEIFAALTHGDGKAIETNARRMLALNFLEQWKVKRKDVNESEYDAQLNAFEYATKELIRTGRTQDIDGALTAYTQLTQSCVKCHQAIRDADQPGRR